MKELCQDLAAEYDVLDAIVAELDESAWEMRTPFFQWTIKDEISHLAYYEEAARLASTDAQGFSRHVEKMLEGFTTFDDLHRKINGIGGRLPKEELLAWWRQERQALLAALATCDAKTRLPWYGPTMSARSFATARLMETWAHGQDVVDALRGHRPATDRLKHIAHLGVSTFGWSFKNRKMTVPDTAVRVELQRPTRQCWYWGPEHAENSVQGAAEDFCLVVTQRRHVADTALVVQGPIAGQWMSIAQAFAGPPENGPGPGERLVGE